MTRSILACFLLLLSGSTLAQECRREGIRRCKSCAEPAFCVNGILEPYDRCSVENLETCFEAGDDNICIAGQTACFCDGRTGCLDDPYSMNYYIDCSASPEEVYKACEEGLVHDGNCGCVKPKRGGDFKKERKYEPVFSAPKEACDAGCPYNTSDVGCVEGTYFPCASNETEFQCPPDLCFDVIGCTCVENSTACTEECALIAVDIGGGCDNWSPCSDLSIVIACITPLCFDQDSCTCLPPPTTTTTTTLYPCPPGCTTFEVPDPEDPSCPGYAPCSVPDFLTRCADGFCFNDDICECEQVAATGSPGGTGTTAGPGSPGGTGTTAGPGSPGGTGTTADPETTTTTPTTTTPTTTPTTTTAPTTTPPTTAPTTTPPTTLPSTCLWCQYMEDPNTECGYMHCSTSTAFACPLNTCFDNVTCMCEEIKRLHHIKPPHESRKQ